MPLHAQLRVLPTHAGPVVADPDEAAAAVLQIDLDAFRAGVQRVLDQLLDHGSGALDDLAGGDLIGERRVEQVDAGHGCAE